MSISVKVSERKLKLTDVQIKKYKKLIPEEKTYNVYFKLSNVHYSYANAFRRVLLDEMKTKKMTFDNNDFETTDAYLLYDFLQSRLIQLPLDQKCPKNEKFHIEVENSSLDPINVMSSQFKSKYIPDTFRICQLNSNCKLKVTCHIEEKFGFEDEKHTIVSSVTILPKTVKNSLTLGGIRDDFTGQFNCTMNDPIELLNEVCKIITAKFNRILKGLQDLNGNTSGQNDILSITKKNDKYDITISEETYTAGNLLVDYIYEMKPEVGFVNCKEFHPHENNMLVTINDSNALALFKTACHKIIDDFQKTSFKKK